MPRLKPETIVPTPTEDEAITRAAMTDPDTFQPTEANLDRFGRDATRPKREDIRKTPVLKPNSP